MARELFKLMAGIDMVHVPYRGDAPAIADLLGGQVQVYFGGVAAAIEYIRAGKLRGWRSAPQRDWTCCRTFRP